MRTFMMKDLWCEMHKALKHCCLGHSLCNYGLLFITYCGVFTQMHFYLMRWIKGLTSVMLCNSYSDPKNIL